MEYTFKMELFHGFGKTIFFRNGENKQKMLSKPRHWALELSKQLSWDIMCLIHICDKLSKKNNNSELDVLRHIRKEKYFSKTTKKKNNQNSKIIMCKIFVWKIMVFKLPSAVLNSR